MTERTITVCGKEVRMLYCTAAENGFEDLSGKSIADIDFTRSKDLMMLALACVVAAYTRDKTKAPITGDDLLYTASPDDISKLYVAAVELRGEWYKVPKVVADELEKETAQATDEEKEQQAKNAPAPTTDTAGL